MTYTNSATYRQKTNASLPAKLFYHNLSTGALFSADSGATWTARTLPETPDDGGALAYKGSTVLISRYNIVYRSVDDGATWTTVTFPAGTLQQGGPVFADANRFYMCPSSQGQILTSTDAITWTIVTVPSAYFYNTGGYGAIISYDSNNVILTGYNGSSGYDICALTNDGGVTWKITTVRYNSSTAMNSFGGDVSVSPDGLGGGTAVFGGQNGGGYYGGNTGNVCSKATAVAGGGFYRTGTNAVTATNAGAYVYTRVE
jgi:hypothetical protein